MDQRYAIRIKLYHTFRIQICTPYMTCCLLMCCILSYMHVCMQEIDKESSSRYKACRGVVCSIGARRAIYVQSNITIVCTGAVPNSRCAKGVVNMNAQGAIVVDSALMTSKAHIYAAGGKQILSDFCVTCLSICLCIYVHPSHYIHTCNAFTQMAVVCHVWYLSVTLFLAHSHVLTHRCCLLPAGERRRDTAVNNAHHMRT